jgi:ribosomal protein S18 acetylase RimI-like enzyme
MRASLHGAFPPPAAGLRCPTGDDITNLGRLMYRAYLGTVDYDGETLAESVAEIRKTFAGDYGSFDAEHSSVAERSGILVSATLITRWQDCPFVAFTMTDPAFGRQGLARATLERSMHLLQQDGETALRLVVTLANTPARRLYEALSFACEP